MPNILNIGINKNLEFASADINHRSDDLALNLSPKQYIWHKRNAAIMPKNI